MMVESSTDRLCCTRCLGIYRTTFERCPRDGGALQPLIGDPLQGSTFADRYIIEECVGEGGMGRVYRARHTNMSRRFAIKILFGELAADETMRSRFAAEAEAASRLDHPNVISVVDFGATDTGLLYLVMDYVDGMNLGSIIDRDAPLATRRTVALVRRMCRGLQHAHEKGLVHRDFKPDNVIVVDANGTELPKIVDFGLARLPEAQQVNSRFTADGTVVGSPPYMAPEHLQDLPVDHRCDLFSLGIVFYEMLAGRTPFSGTPFEIAHHNVQSSIPPIAKRTPGVSVAPEIEAIVIKLLQKVPENRFASAAEVVEELDRVMPRDRLRSSPTTGPPLFSDAEEEVEDYNTPPPTVVTPPRQASATEFVEVARPKRGPLVPILAVLMAAAAGVVIYAMQSTSKSGGEKSAQGGTPPATASPAQPAVAEAPPDAAPQRAQPPDAGVSTERLARAQSEVVEATDSLERSHGPDAAAPFRTRYAAIHYDEALSDISLRPGVLAELAELGGEITAAQEAAPPKKASKRKKSRRKRSKRKKRRKVERGGVIDAFGDD